jgi:uncharacterized protein YbjT (DUF2867 family)
MKVILFGASGMVGQAVLRECLLDPQVESVLAIVRSAGSQPQPKLQEHVHADFTDFSALDALWRGYDACLFCLGVSSAGISEAEYRRVSYDYTLAAARPLSRLNPAMTFIYVSGAGTDSSENGRSMWARVKGATENALLALPFKAVMFRPGMIIPMHGVVSKTRSYRVIYALTRPLWGLLLAAFPQAVTSSEKVARAMLKVALKGSPKSILETRDINQLVP